MYSYGDAWTHIVSSALYFFFSDHTHSIEQHTIRLPMDAKQSNVCFKWQHSIQNGTGFNSQGCWAIDDVLITNDNDLPTNITEDFNPMTKSNWLYWTGGDIKVKHTKLTRLTRHTRLTRLTLQITSFH